MRTTALFGAVAGISVSVALAAACASGNAEAPPVTSLTVPPPPPPASEVDAAATLRPAPGAEAGGVTASVSPPLAAAGDAGAACGCKLCAPVVSDDACTADADCAPEVPCHATRCVAKAKATPRRPGQACTMSMMCTSIDANACGCVKSRCTLHAR
jgi:hypothetical protein